jgi:hypothetical protein
MAAGPHTSRKAPGRTRAARRRAAADPEPEDPVWPGIFKGQTYFYFQKIISLFEKP